VNLIDVTRTFKTDDDCLAYLETMRWPHGIRCPVCGCNEISKITRKNVITRGPNKGKPSKNVRTRIYQCLEKTCKVQFSATNGTIFNDSHLPLTKWFMALALIVDAKKGISANQLMEHLGIGSYRTAWYMCHRIRKAMENNSLEKMTGTVEIDETYMGGKVYSKGTDGRKIKNKETVIGMKQRGGKLRFLHIKDITAKSLGEAIAANVSTQVERVMTDDWKAYPRAFMAAGIHGSKHSAINHSQGVYVRGDVTTNGIESAFSLLKRGFVGSFHRMSIDHLHRYLSEFEYRFNERKNPERFEKTLSRMLGVEPMPYAELIG